MKAFGRIARRLAHGVINVAFGETHPTRPPEPIITRVEGVDTYIYPNGASEAKYRELLPTPASIANDR